MTLEQAIDSYEKNAERYHKAFLRNKAHGGEFYQREAESDRICEEHERQLAAWLRELVERRKEPAIPVAWIEKYIEWLKSLDNEFAKLAAAHISVMLKKWRSEQNETD